MQVIANKQFSTILYETERIRLQVYSASKHIKRARRQGRSAKTSWDPSWNRDQVFSTDVEAAELVVECGRRLDRMLGAMASARLAGDSGAVRDRQKILMRSSSARIAAMAKSVRRSDLKWSASKIVVVGQSLDLWSYSGELVRLTWIPKPSGGSRPVFAFGPKEYAKGWLALGGCKIICQLSGQQFLHNGGVPRHRRLADPERRRNVGRYHDRPPELLRVLSRQHVEADGLLPKSVMKALLYDPMALAKEKKGPFHCVVGPDGLPTGISVDGAGSHPMPGAFPAGSALTSLLADQRIRSLLDAVEKAVESVMVASFADNIIILAPTMEKADAANIALRDAVLVEYGKHVADEVWHRMRQAPVTEGFYFLNDHYRIEDGALRRRMSDSLVEGYPARLQAEIHDEKLSGDQIERRLKSWENYRSYDPRTAGVAAGFRQMLKDEGVAYGDTYQQSEDISEASEDDVVLDGPVPWEA